MNRTSNTALIVSITVIACFTMATAAAIFIAVPDGANTGSLITILFGSLAPTIASMVALAKVNRTNDTVEKLTNGLMDSKIRAGVADVLDPTLIAQGAHAQVAADRANRDNNGGDGGTS